MQDLQFPPKAPAPVAKKRRANRAEQRRLVDDTLGQVLVLLSQKASHNILTEILEALHRQIQTLFDE